MSNTCNQAWALLAVSSEQQQETLQHQRAWAEETATAHGWRLARILEAVGSGKDGPRRIVRELLADLKSCGPELRPRWLLMIRADRLGRGSVIESQIALKDLQALGVSAYTRDQGEVKIDSAMGELISAATLAVARHENEVRRDKMVSVYRRKRAAGKIIGNRPAYGLIISDDGRTYKPDGKRAAVVKEAFRLRIAGTGYHVIGQRLAAIAPPHAFKHSERSYSVRWTQTRVSRLLSNHAYAGVIVDEATFARAQRVSAKLPAADRSRDKRRRWPWPLSGAIRCFCGRAMSGMACGSEEHRTRYYCCRASWNHDVSNRLVRADDLEEQFVALLRRLRASPELIDRYRRKAASPVSPKILERTLRDLKTQLAEVARRRDAAWELHAQGRVHADDVQERLDALAEKRRSLDAQVASVSEQIAVAKVTADRNHDADALIRRAAATFTRANEAERRQIAQAVALELGGLCVEQNGRLVVRAVVDSNPQRKPIRRNA